MLKDIFIEAFRAHFLPFFSEITLSAMQAFDYEIGGTPVASAFAGALLAIFIWFRIGRVAAKFWRAKNDERYQSKAARLQPYALGLMLFVSAPVGFAIAFAAGLLNARAGYALPLGALGIAFSYLQRFV